MQPKPSAIGCENFVKFYLRFENSSRRRNVTNVSGQFYDGLRKMENAEHEKSFQWCVFAFMKNSGANILRASFFRMNLGPGNSLESVTNCSQPIAFEQENVSRVEEEALLDIFEGTLIICKNTLNLLYVLNWNKSSLFRNLLSLLLRSILRSEIDLVNSFVVNCCNYLFETLASIVRENGFAAKVEIVLDVYIGHKLEEFFNSIQGEYDYLRKRIKETAITVTETATESSATLGIESAAQALGQAAVGVGITVMIDLALTSHSLYKAKKAKDSGLIDTEQFETKVKKKVCESGFQFIGGTTGSVVGQMIIPIPVVGAFVGGLCGSLIGTGIGKGVNYGLFDRRQGPVNEARDLSCFKLIASVLETIISRNPDFMIIYVEKEKIFSEKNFDAPPYNVKSSNRETRSKFPIMHLIENKLTRKKALIQKKDRGSKQMVNKSERRYSDSVGIFRRQVRTRSNGKKLSRENSFSATCIDRCSEEILINNDDKDVQGVFSKSNENPTDERVFEIEDKNTEGECMETGESYAGENTIKAEKLFESILSCKEEERDGALSVTENEGDDGNISLKKAAAIKGNEPTGREQSPTTQEVPFKVEILAESDGDDDNEVKSFFDVAKFGKIASFWKDKIKFSQNDEKDGRREARALQGGLVRRMFEGIQRSGKPDKESGDGERIMESKVETSEHILATENNSSNKARFDKKSGREYDNDGIENEDRVFLRQHAAYGLKMKELAANACIFHVTEINDVQNETPMQRPCPQNTNDGKCERSNHAQAILKWTGISKISRRDEEDSHKNMPRNDDKKISYLAKDFIARLRNMTEKRQRWDKKAENPETDKTN